MNEVTPCELRKKRESKGLTQYDIAEEVGIRPGTVSKIESGDFFPESTVNKIVSVIEDAKPKYNTEAQDIMDTRIQIVSEDQRISEIANGGRIEDGVIYLCVGDKIKGWARETEFRVHNPNEKISSIMNEDFKIISPETRPHSILNIFQNHPIVIVVASSKPVGAITREGI